MASERPKTNFIWNVVADYHDNAQRQIRELAVVSGAVPENFPRYIGRALLRQQQGIAEIEFPIYAVSLEEAFNLYDAALAEKMKAPPMILNRLGQPLRSPPPAPPKPRIEG